MRKRIRNRKRYEKRVVNPRNRLIICLSYGFNGLNLLVSGIYLFLIEQDEISYKYVVLLALVMFVMVPLSYSDDREEMQGNLCAVLSIIVYLAVGLLTAYFTWWMLIFCGVEMIIAVIIVYSKYLKPRRRKSLKNK